MSAPDSYQKIANIIGNALAIGDDSPPATKSVKASKPRKPQQAAKPRREPQRDRLMAATEPVELWHAPDSEAFGTLPVGDHFETWPIRSSAFKRWLACRAYEETGEVPGSQALEDTLRILEAKAFMQGKQQAPWRRVGEREGRIYLDLGDPAWRAVEVHKHGWSVIEKHRLPFIRSASMTAMVEPEQGYGIELLRGFVNANDDDFTLTVAWLCSALRPSGPYPILTINGEQGSGKSNFSRLIRSLVDPSVAPIRAAPRDDRDLLVSALNSHVLAYDNLSKIEPWLADALCRLATGGGFSTRALHTDKEEMVFQATRPLILNGIPLLTDRPDLADRAVTIRLRSIPETERRAEDDLAREWNEAAPKVLGALLTGVSAGLRKIADVRLAKAPRLADFAKWTTACETGLGWEPGAFMAIYTENRKDIADTAFEADPVAMAIAKLVGSRRDGLWNGTATELLSSLCELVTEATKRSRSWPMTAQGLGNRVDRVAPLLRGRGILTERRHSGVRTITFTGPPNPNIVNEEY